MCPVFCRIGLLDNESQEPSLLSLISNAIRCSCSCIRMYLRCSARAYSPRASLRVLDRRRDGQRHATQVITLAGGEQGVREFLRGFRLQLGSEVHVLSAP